jgi:hypothetical protein
VFEGLSSSFFTYHAACKTFLTTRIRNISMGQPFAIGQRADMLVGDLDEDSGKTVKVRRFDFTQPTPKTTNTSASQVAVKVLRAVPYDDDNARRELRRARALLYYRIPICLSSFFFVLAELGNPLGHLVCPKTPKRR